MTAESTPRLQLPFIMAAQAQKHVTHNESLRTLDALVQLAVADKDLSDPPATPSEGEAYIVASGAHGAWEPHAGHIAIFQDGAWAFHAPREGWLAWVADEDKLYVFNGASWAPVTGTDNTLNPASVVGINTTADETNRLVVASPASLFTHAGGDHRQKINKAATEDTASTLYQTGYSGRAEIGLAGDDNFQFKVSPDGGVWRTALTLVGATGVPRVPVFTIATLPSASDSGAGAIICISDAEGGPVLALSDGAVWLEQSGSVVARVASPTFSPAEGTYTSVQSVSIGCATEDATIHYTTDGSTPNEESPVYSGPVAVSASQTLKAVARREGMTDSAIATAAYVINLTTVPLIIVAGESNAAGWALNSLATAGELAVRSNVRILNNADLELEALDVGTNNQIQDGVTVNTTTHGLEIGFANTLDAGRWPSDIETLFLVKAGRDGAKSDEWLPDAGTDYWADLVTRVEAARSGLAALGVVGVPVVIWSLGLNETGGVATSTWKTRIETIFANVRTLLGAGTPIYMTRFDYPIASDGEWFNPAIDAIAAADANVHVISTLDIGGGDASAVMGEPGVDLHWGYAGFLDMAERIVDMMYGASGALAAPSFSLAGGNYTGDQTLTITGPSGATIRYTTDGSQPSSHAAVYSGPLTLSADVTVRAIAMKRGWKNSPETSADYEISAGFVNWTGLVNASQVGNSISVTATNGGGRATTAIDATQAFSVVYWYEGSSQDGMMVFLDDDADTNYNVNESSGVTYPCGGMYAWAGSFVRTIGPGANGAGLGSLGGTPALMRMRKSGNDIVYDKSTDGGATWSSVLYTLTGVLAGKTTLYLKAASGNHALQLKAQIIR
jgi:hypothetical protein